MLNLTAIASARAALAYVLADAGTALRNEIDMLIAGGGSDRNIAKYTAEVRYCQEIGAMLDGYEAGANAGYSNAEGRARNAAQANALAATINTLGITRMRIARDERIEAARMGA
jgi:hypothetical protein